MFTKLLYGRNIDELLVQDYKPEYFIKLSRPYYLTL